MSHVSDFPSIETGDPTIDLQHANLYALVEDLGAIVQHGADHAQVAGILFGLLRYATTHFADEEALMARESYPGLETQRQMHQAFAEQATSLAKEYIADSGVSARDIHRFVEAWLTEHVATEDRMLAEYLRARRADS